MRRRALRALFPLGFAALAIAWQHPALGGARAPDAGAALVAARALAALVLVLGWRFRRGRAIWAAALLLLGVEMRRRGIPAGEPTLARCMDPAVVLGLGLAAPWVEAPLVSRRSLGRFAGLGIAALAVPVLAHPELDGLVAALGSAGLGLWGTVISPLGVEPTVPGPPLAALATLVGLAVAAVAWGLRRRALDGGLFAAALLVSVAWWTSGPVAAGTAAAALLILALTIVDGAARIAFEDPLTGLPGRRALDERLDRLRGAYCLAMVDLDRFKKLNDRWGHDVGDQVLALVASKVRRVGARGEAFRFGGEEMTVVFDRCERDRAREALEEVRREIADHPFRQRTAPRKGGAKKGGGRRIPVTVSIGLADSEGASGPREVLEAADKALYRAKRAGRNRVVAGGRRRRR